MSSASPLDRGLVQEWMRWSSIFDLWDVDGDGYIDMDEIKQGIQYFLDTSGANFTSFEVRSILADMSLSDEEIKRGLNRQTFGSFLSSLALAVGVPLEVLASSLADQCESGAKQVPSSSSSFRDAWNRIPELFSKWDTDNDEKISRHELSVAVRKYRGVTAMRITLADILSMMDASDVDGDKKMNIVEMGAWLGRFSLASGSKLSDIVDFFLEESSHAHEEEGAAHKQSLGEEAMAKGWQEMPLLFDIMDIDNSGTIDRKELTACMNRLIADNGLKFTLSECHAIMSEVDLNRDNQLDRREFGCFLSRFSLATDLSLDEVTYYLMKQSEEADQNRLRKRNSMEIKSLEKGWADMPKLFALWDKNGDGYLNREELAMGINRWRTLHRGECKISLAESLQLMDEVDVDGNRVLDKMEFGAFLARFSLATGVKLDELTEFFFDQYQDDDAQAQGGRGGVHRQGSARPKGQGFLSSFLARANIGLAEESVETQRELAR